MNFTQILDFSSSTVLEKKYNIKTCNFYVVYAMKNKFLVKS